MLAKQSKSNYITNPFLLFFLKSLDTGFHKAIEASFELTGKAWPALK